ncbi:MAG: hypothetical protein MZV64_63280 [Ignavibacteriales bacterium]|nr:hypothetical protein [Ignavibacteriales bacterium]
MAFLRAGRHGEGPGRRDRPQGPEQSDVRGVTCDAWPNGSEAHYTERLLRRRRLPASLPATSAASASPGPTATVKAGFVLPFRERAVVPSFDRPNVTDPAALEEAIAQAMKSLRLVVRNGRPAHPRALRPGLRPGRRFLPRLRARSGTPSSAGASAS